MIGTAVPSFPRGVRFQFDSVRQSWIVQAPERLFMPDEHAVEVLKLVDGKRSVDQIVDDLAARYAAPRETIADDVSEMLDGLADKGAVTL
jgi:pyrroloquinoline quinone biosynthesis protein D